MKTEQLTQKLGVSRLFSSGANVHYRSTQLVFVLTCMILAQSASAASGLEKAADSWLNEPLPLLDTSFNPVLPGAVQQTAVDADGRLVVVTVANDISMASDVSMYSTVIWLDQNGVALKRFQLKGLIQAYFPLPDGKFLLKGEFSTTNGLFNFARFNSDGSVDPSFKPAPEL